MGTRHWVGEGGGLGKGEQPVAVGGESRAMGRGNDEAAGWAGHRLRHPAATLDSGPPAVDAEYMRYGTSITTVGCVRVLTMRVEATGYTRMADGARRAVAKGRRGERERQPRWRGQRQVRVRDKGHSGSHLRVRLGGRGRGARGGVRGGCGGGRVGGQGGLLGGESAAAGAGGGSTCSRLRGAGALRLPGMGSGIEDRRRCRGGMAGRTGVGRASREDRRKQVMWEWQCGAEEGRGQRARARCRRGCGGRGDGWKEA